MSMVSNRSNNYGTSRLISPVQAGFATRSRVPALALGSGPWGLPVLAPTWPIGQNLLVLGPPRSGKGASFFMPALLGLPAQPNPRPSCVVSDPKGELLAISRERLEASGYQVKIVSFDRPEISDSWNPLSWLDPADPGDEISYSGAQQLAQAMIPTHRGEREPFWGSMSRLIMSASAVLAYRRGQSRGRPGTLADALALTYMAASDPASLAAAAQGLDSWAADQLGIVASATAGDKRLAGNISVDTIARFNTWTTPGMLRILGDSDWTWSSVIDQPTVVFVLGSASHASHQCVVWGSLIAAAHHVQRRAGRLYRPLWVLLDEVGNVGEIPGLLDALATLTGAGVSTCLGLQSIRQLNDVYGTDKASAIADASHVVVAFPGLGHDSADWVSDRLGMATATTHTRQTGRDGSVSFGPQQFQRKVLLADEVSTLHRSRIIVQRGGRRAALITARPYYNNPRWRAEARAGDPRHPQIAERLEAMRHSQTGESPNLEELAQRLLGRPFVPPDHAGPEPTIDPADLGALLRGDR